MSPRFAAMGSHHSQRAQTEDWWTPPHIINALGGPESFALDPCAPLRPQWACARQSFSPLDDGLSKLWDGRVWLNPPYSTEAVKRWLARLAQHGEGTALIFARTETDTFFRHGWEAANAMLFIRKRLNFHYPDGTDPARCFEERGLHEFVVMNAATGAQGCRFCGMAKKNSGAPSVLIAYGTEDADILAFCGIAGQFVPLRFPRSWLIEAIEPTWRELVGQLMGEAEGPVRLEDIYRRVADHPKARRNRNVEAKVRQQLQRGPYQRLGRGLWEKSA